MHQGGSHLVKYQVAERSWRCTPRVESHRMLTDMVMEKVGERNDANRHCARSFYILSNAQNSPTKRGYGPHFADKETDVHPS